MIWGYVLMCFIYGTTFLAIRVGDVAGMPPALFAAMRFVTAGVIILLYALWRNGAGFPRSAQMYRALVRIGLFNTTAVFAITYVVEQYVPSNYAALMSATLPLMVMLINRMVDKQRITVLQFTGLVVGFLGVLSIAWPGIRAGIPHWLASTLALLGAAAAAAIGATQSRKILMQGLTPLVANGFQLLFGGVGLLAIAAVTGGLTLASVHDWTQGVLALLYLTVFGSIIASGIFYWLVKRASALFASTWTYVSPVIAVAVGYWWYHEPVHTLTLLGAALILGGVLLVNLQAFREAYRIRLRARSEGLAQ